MGPASTSAPPDNTKGSMYTEGAGCGAYRYSRCNSVMTTFKTFPPTVRIREDSCSTTLGFCVECDKQAAMTGMMPFLITVGVRFAVLAARARGREVGVLPVNAA